jgi:hypothetical protein
MRVLRIAAVFAVLAGPAYAQMPAINMLPGDVVKTPEEREAEAARDNPEEDTRRQSPFRSVGHGARRGCAQDGGAGETEDQDRQCPNQNGDALSVGGRCRGGACAEPSGQHDRLIHQRFVALARHPHQRGAVQDLDHAA